MFPFVLCLTINISDLNPCLSLYISVAVEMRPRVKIPRTQLDP